LEENNLFPDVSPTRFGNGRRRQRLFLPKYLRAAGADMRLAGSARDEAHRILVRWADLESSGKLFKKKETSLEGEFLAEVFGEALGYTLFSENLASWQLEPKFSVPGGIADAAIGFFSQQNEKKARALVELKGPRIDLDRHRERGRTPVQQCWDYLNAVPECPWGIVCNYVSFRLYHRNKTPQAYELFTLQELREPEKFNEFYAVFAVGGLLPSLIGQKPRADDLLEQSETLRRTVGKELYRKYREERLDLIRMLRDPPYGRSLDDAIRIVQGLLDRIIFIAFCEQRGLLPEKAIDHTWRDIQPWTHATNPRWDNFKNLFKSIDQGNERDGITAYDGVLFRKNADMDNLDLADARTDFFKEIASYDFRETVNVDVLGHIFEQSVTELEQMRASPELLDAPSGREPVGKRKREGIYYTPPHITKYIVDNTLGVVIEERFAALAEKFGVDADAEPSPETFAASIKYNQGRWDALRLIRVCDPACGSGAFLIQAYELLEDAYDEVVTALCLRQGPQNEKLYEEISRTILRENLHGVDLSREAVEITQLALWLRTARRGQSLADLSQHIKVGNSLADDPKIDAHAFDWPREFPSIMAEGGFDCVIGNPPYVKLQNFRKREPRIAEFLVHRYKSARTGNFDMYLPFIERGLELLKPDGRMGFIAPNVWLFNEYGRGLRELVAETGSLQRFVDFKSHQIFEDATTYTALQFFTKRRNTVVEAADASHGDLKKLDFHPVDYSRLSAGAWALIGDVEQSILEKMREQSVTLADASEQIFQGLITSADAVYHLLRLGPGRYYSQILEREVDLEDEIVKPLVSGEDAVPFATPPTDKYLIFPYLVKEDECRLYTEREMKKSKRCWAYLKENEKLLRARESGKFDDDEWWRFGRHQNIDKQHRAKILVPRLLLHLFAAADPKGATCIDNVDVGGVIVENGWDMFFILALLNSNACDFAWHLTSKPFRGEYRSANKQFIAPLPIPKTKDQKPLARLAKELAGLPATRLATAAAVHRRLRTDLPPARPIRESPLPPTLTRRLVAFDKTPRNELFTEMEKLAESKLGPAAREKWDEYLTKQTNGMAMIQRSIDDKMAELNERAYALYGLSGDEVEHIEQSLARSGAAGSLAS
jgi:type I restriction-modification system DNA methylase subunit